MLESLVPDHLLMLKDNKKSLVFIHGFLGCPDDWLPVIQVFQHDYCIVALSLYQLIESLEDVTFSSVCSSIRQELDRLNIKKPVLIGYSLGGRIAMEYARLYSDEISGLILESAHIGFQKDYVQEKQDYLATSQARCEDFESVDLKTFVSDWYQQPFFNITKMCLSSQQLLDKIRLPKTLLSRLLSRLTVLDQVYFGDYYHQLACPCVYISGQLDLKYSTMTKDLKSFSGLSTYVLPHADHNVHVSQLNTYKKVMAIELKRVI
jgi:2-succinyl-6-hydroxy-2,4-cyclohexadiene-1-carboxylate synthase